VQGWTNAFTVNFFIYLGMTYALLLLEPKEILNFREVIKRFREGNKKKFYSIIPLWSVTALFTILGAFVAFFSYLIDSKPLQDFFWWMSFTTRNEMGSGFVYFSIIGFMIRDIAFVLLINLSGRRKRADATASLYLIILYFIIPFLIKETGLGFLFYPSNDQGIILMIITPYIEAILIIQLLVRLWKQKFSALQTS
jgi:hypothetical protein